MSYLKNISRQILKNSMLLALALLMIPGFLIGQDDKKNLYEVVRIKVKAGQEKAFEAAVKSHNQKFHGEGLYRANLAFNINGPYGNTYSWIMGPTNYAAMDTRPTEGAHDDDWKKVDAFIDEISAPTYWSLDRKHSSLVQNDASDKDLIWMFDIESGQTARWTELVGKVKEVYEKKRPNESFRVVWNEFSDTNKGHDAAILFGMTKWGFLDLERDFGKTYEEVHGPNTWSNFLTEFRATVKARVDWMRKDVK